MNIDKSIKRMLGTTKKFGGKNDWDGDGVPNRRDCQPRNTMRQDKIKSGWIPTNEYNYYATGNSSMGDSTSILTGYNNINAKQALLVFYSTGDDKPVYGVAVNKIHQQDNELGTPYVGYRKIDAYKYISMLIRQYPNGIPVRVIESEKDWNLK